MIKYISILILIVNISSKIFSKEDTLSSALPDIKITADRILSEQSLKYNSYNLISQSAIAKINPWQTNEILNHLPGIFINDYGGLGGLKTISMRGTTSSQSVIMIDGIRFNSSQNSIADMSIFPSNIFDEIEVVRGGSSALFGGNAIGGIVNFRSRDFEKNKFILSLNAGSFGEYFINTKTEFGTDNFNQMFSGEFKTSEGAYPFISKETYKKHYRSISDLAMFSVASLTKYENSQWKISNRIILNYSDRNIPGPFIENHENKISTPELTEKSSLFFISAIKTFNPITSLFVGINAKINEYNYIDSSFLGSGYPLFKAEFFNQDLMINLKYNSNFKNLYYSFCIETGYSSLRGNQLDYSVSDEVERLLFAFSGNVNSKINLKSLGNIDYSIGLRFDKYSDAGQAISSFIGILYVFQNIPLQIKGQISSNFRPPSFNEMYYLNFGNKDLKPEKSLSYNLGLSYNLIENIAFQLNGFYMNTDDRIVSVPKSQVLWSAENISNVTNKGIEFSTDMNYFNKVLNLNFAYTFQDVRNTTEDDNNFGKFILYTPQEIISGAMILNYSVFSFGSIIRYSGHYFSLPDNSYESLIDGYSLIDIFLNYTMKLSIVDLNIRLDCKNIFDQQYVVIKNYPMPGRSVRFGISIKY